MRQIDTISLLVTSGNGPAECRLAVGHVLHRMQANARNLAAAEERKSNENRLHNALERGNPTRVFQAATFLQKGGG
jgi:hypothetical protein